MITVIDGMMGFAAIMFLLALCVLLAFVIVWLLCYIIDYIRSWIKDYKKRNGDGRTDKNTEERP